MAAMQRSSDAALLEAEGVCEETKTSSKWSREWQSEMGGQQVSLWMRQSKDEVRWEVASEASAARFAAVLDHAGLVAADMDPRMDVEELVHLMVSLCEEGRIAVTDAHSGCVVRLSHCSNQYQFPLERQEWTEKDQRLWELSKENARLKEENERLKKDLAKEREKSARLTRDLGEEVRKREELQRRVEVMEMVRQFSKEYVSEIAEREGLSVMEHSKIDGLIAAKMGEWEGIAERDGDGWPVFILKMREYADESKDPWHAIQAQYLYLNRREVRADEKYNGRNALHICAKYPSLSPMMQWLLEDGNIDPNKRTSFLKSAPLHCAALRNNIECASLLLNDERVDKDAKNDIGDTPLINAAQFNNPLMVSLLLQHGCNKDIRNIKGKTALMIAEENGHTEVVRLLKDSHSTPKKGFFGWF